MCKHADIAAEYIICGPAVNHVGGCTQIIAAFCGDTGNDIDCAAYSTGSIQRRSTSPDHFDPVNHVGRDLLHAVKAGKGTEYRAAVDKDLGITTSQSIHSQLGIVTGLAISLNPKTGLKTESF